MGYAAVSSLPVTLWCHRGVRENRERPCHDCGFVWHDRGVISDDKYDASMTLTNVIMARPSPSVDSCHIEPVMKITKAEHSGVSISRSRMSRVSVFVARGSVSDLTASGQHKPQHHPRRWGSRYNTTDGAPGRRQSSFSSNCIIVSAARFSSSALKWQKVDVPEVFSRTYNLSCASTHCLVTCTASLLAAGLVLARWLVKVPPGEECQHWNMVCRHLSGHWDYNPVTSHIRSVSCGFNFMIKQDKSGQLGVHSDTDNPSCPVPE